MATEGRGSTHPIVASTTEISHVPLGTQPSSFSFLCSPTSWRDGGCRIMAQCRRAEVAALDRATPPPPQRDDGTPCRSVRKRTHARAGIQTRSAVEGPTGRGVRDRRARRTRGGVSPDGPSCRRTCGYDQESLDKGASPGSTSKRGCKGVPEKAWHSDFFLPCSQQALCAPWRQAAHFRYRCASGAAYFARGYTQERIGRRLGWAGDFA